MDKCIFCQIVKGEAVVKKIWESKEIVAFVDIAPQAPVHVLVIPKQHIENMTAVSDDDGRLLGKLMLAIRDVVKKLGIEKAFQLKIYNGKDAGQTVFHLHVHLMGGWKEKQQH